MELLGNATAALTEAGIAYLAIIHQDLSASGLDSFHNMDVICLRDTLVALTMVIGAYIKDGMVVTIVPAYQLIIFLHEREETIAARRLTLPLLHLGQQPTAGDNGMGLEEFQ